MLIRIADDERIFMVDASAPKSDLAKGEAVWKNMVKVRLVNALATKAIRRFL